MSREAEGRAKYRLIADELRSAIGSGTFAPGDRLPGENALMEQYGVARMTARQALSVLQNEGLTTTRKGAGVFVRDFQPIVREGIARLSRERWASGRGIWDAEQGNRPLTVDKIKVRQVKASGYVADALGLKAGESVVVRDRRYLLDGRAVMLAVSSLPASIAAGTPIADKDTGAGGVYARLAELDLAPAHFREDLRARMPSDDEASTLGLDAGTPVITIARMAFTTDGRAVELNEMTLDASVYVLRYDFDA
ncbi:MAG TPA: GntR family transcriptional regulator [Jiangellaceae bacterium]